VIFAHLKRTIGLHLKDDLSDPDYNYRYRPWCRGAADMHRTSRRIVSHNYLIVCSSSFLDIISPFFDVPSSSISSAPAFTYYYLLFYVISRMMEGSV
jgi:hypothetical protein